MLQLVCLGHTRCVRLDPVARNADGTARVRRIMVDTEPFRRMPDGHQDKGRARGPPPQHVTRRAPAPSAFITRTYSLRAVSIRASAMRRPSGDTDGRPVTIFGAGACEPATAAGATAATV